jgi:hypothetical protein
LPRESDVELHVAAQAHEGGLDVSYRLVNRTDQQFVVFNHLAPGKPNDADAVQIAFTGTNLLLSKQVPPWPDMIPPHYRVPAQSLLDPGAQIAERFTVPLPAVVNNAILAVWLQGMSGGKTEYRPMALRRTNRISLTIGILPVRAGVQVLELVGAPRIYVAQGADLETEQLTISDTVLLSEPIEVLDYEPVHHRASR